MIIAVVSGISAPHLARFYKALKLDTSARQLKTLFSYAQTVAISEKKVCVVKLENGWRKINLSLEKDKNEATEKGGEIVEFEPLEWRFSSYELIEGIEIESIEKNDSFIAKGSETSVSFPPLFFPEEMTFLLKDSEGEKIVIKILAGSGRVVIEDV